jgi:Putative amidoligase enzyme
MPLEPTAPNPPGNSRNRRRARRNPEPPPVPRVPCLSCGAEVAATMICGIGWCPQCCASRHMTCEDGHHVFIPNGNVPLCSDCDRRCSACQCSCSQYNRELAQEVVTRTTGSGVFFSDHPSRARQLNFPRFLGVEIEVCNARAKPRVSPLNKVKAQWGFGVVRDGSLPDTGFEIQTSPANGKQFIEQIDSIGQALKAHNATVSERAGLHTHVDARDHSWNDLSKLLRLYAKIEVLLFKGILFNRAAASYCRSVQEIVRDMPINEATDTELSTEKANTITTWYGNPVLMPSRRNHHYDASRYFSLNLHSWAQRQTVEWRLHHGTVDPIVIKNWAQLCSSFTHSVFAMPSKEVKKQSELSATEILYNTCGAELTNWWKARTDAVPRRQYVPGLL